MLKVPRLIRQQERQIFWAVAKKRKAKFVAQKRKASMVALLYKTSSYSVKF